VKRPRPARILALALLVLARGPDRAPAAPVPGSLVVGGVERHYIFVLPAAYDGRVPMPVVFVFHGAGNDGAALERSLGFTQLQSQKYFLAVYPDGIDKAWNGGRTAPTSLASARSDDVVFVSALIDAIGARFRIDPKRVYATGSSNGAIFCDTLAVRLSGRIAAIAPVNGVLGPSVPAKFHAKNPVSVISFNGTDDPFVPFAGVADPDDRLLSAPDTIAFWVKFDGCDPQPEITDIPRAVPDDGTSVKRFEFGGGRDGTAVVAYIIAHGGHTWPGYHTDPGWAKLAGRTTMSVNATVVMWDFFANHPKP
jgi:polyhydroxybutyrate depolymerase